MKVLDVKWFTGRDCIGIVKVDVEYEGICYYIGVVDGQDEEDDKQLIAEWGTRFPVEYGEALFPPR